MKAHIAAIVILLLLLLSGCKTQKNFSDIVHESNIDTVVVVSIDTVRVESIEYRKDSIFVIDSVIVNIDSLGNKVKEIWHWKYKYNNESAKLTELQKMYDLLLQKKDSVVTKTKEVEVVKDVVPLSYRIYIFITSLLLICVVSVFLRKKLKL